MITVAPDYYPEFHCIAGECRHTCCAGWEIDIDEDTLEKYQNCPGDFGDRLRSHIVLSPEDEIRHENDDFVPHFRLQEKERCPFLNSDNLCEIILHQGEEALCQICTDHPRFRNYWTNRTEIGLGLACEEAARLILSWENPVNLVEIDAATGEKAETIRKETQRSGDDRGIEEQFYEEDLLDDRDFIFGILQDRTIPVDLRVEKVLREYNLEAHMPKLAQGPLNEIACEQLCVYLVYRHLADALYDDRFEERLIFVADSYATVRNRWAQSGKTAVCDLIEAARTFSEEVEYDTDTWDTI